ncbi:MAG TPA: hypothetical protein VE782_08955 [Myxococcaceae bacterium]|nr:hypothetical protein [Myxococcaceae bacterium]
MEESERGSAKVLAFIADHAIQEFVRLRDVARDQARGDLERLGGTAIPALWDGERLYEGAEAAIARLMAFLNIGRSG